MIKTYPFDCFSASAIPVEQRSRDQWTHPWRMLVNPATSELASVPLCIVLFLVKDTYSASAAAQHIPITEHLRTNN